MTREALGYVIMNEKKNNLEDTKRPKQTFSITMAQMDEKFQN